MRMLPVEWPASHLKIETENSCMHLNLATGNSAAKAPLARGGPLRRWFAPSDAFAAMTGTVLGIIGYYAHRRISATVLVLSKVVIHC